MLTTIRQRAERVDLVGFAAALVASLAAGVLVQHSTLLRLGLAGILILLVAVVGVRAPRPLLLALPVWLVALGLIRRLLTGLSSSGPADPLLLVGPLALVVLTFATFDRGAFQRLTTLAKLVLAYSLLVLLGAANPEQGSVTAGATALIFFVPLLAFWIGRGLVDRQLLQRLLIVVGILGIPAALYGLRQTFGGFPTWDQRWIEEQGYTSLNVGGVTRPFSSFSSAAEYATFLAIAMAIWLQLGPRRFLRPISLAVAGLLAVAVFYQSSRGTIVMLLGGGAVMLAARRRLPLTAAASLGAALLLAVPAVVKQIAPSTYDSGDPTASLVQHQVEGLANPLDPNASTAGAHMQLVVSGIESAFHHPAGHGISQVTIAGKKFGAQTTNTEADISNAAVALGLPGFLLFVAIFAVGFGAAYRLARGGGRLEVVAVGILTVTTMQWLNGGQYSVAFLPWLLLGWVDRQLVERTRPEVEEVEEPEAAPSAVLPAPRPRPPRPAPPRLALRPPPPPAPAEPAAGDPEPRRWDVHALSRLPNLTDEEYYLLAYLRAECTVDGLLPVEFDPLVRSTFGDRLDERAP
ncbi:MAG TPA: hypothetical protein VFJ77_07830 [Gaiellaceae bacterium]|nr:hypothetical protein [Gaiellaceae bacterium]